MQRVDGGDPAPVLPKLQIASDPPSFAFSQLQCIDALLSGRLTHRVNVRLWSNGCSCYRNGPVCAHIVAARLWVAQKRVRSTQLPNRDYEMLLYGLEGARSTTPAFANTVLLLQDAPARPTAAVQSQTPDESAADLARELIALVTVLPLLSPEHVASIRSKIAAASSVAWKSLILEQAGGAGGNFSGASMSLRRLTSRREVENAASRRLRLVDSDSLSHLSVALSSVSMAPPVAAPHDASTLAFFDWRTDIVARVGAAAAAAASSLNTRAYPRVVALSASASAAAAVDIPIMGGASALMELDDLLAAPAMAAPAEESGGLGAIALAGSGSGGPASKRRRLNEDDTEAVSCNVKLTSNY